MTKSHKWAVGIIVAGVIVIWWMKNNLQAAGVIQSPTSNGLFSGVPQLHLDPGLQQEFASTINAQPGTTAFPSELQ